MRIAVFHDLPSGGAKRALWEQVNGLRRLGHRVDAFIPGTAEETYFPLAEAANTVRTFERPPVPARERVLEGRPSPLDPLRWALYLRGVRRLERRIADALDEGGYDVALVHGSQFTQAPFVLRFLRTPSVYYCQEPLRAAYEPRITPLPLRVLIRQTLGRLDRANLHAATAVAVNSRFSAGRVQAIYGRSARVIYLAVDAERFRPTSDRRQGFVLTVGALHPLKGLDFLVDVLARLSPETRPPLMVVSDRSRDAERRRLEARAAATGVRITFRFRVPEEELVKLYNQARVVLYAPHREPFGLVPLEAMACGRPVLAVREGGIPETVVEGETGFLEDRDPDRFAARLAGLLADPEEMERIARRAAERVRARWRWDRSVAELAALCEETASVAPAPAKGSG